jgi:hypothetical protein
VLRPASPEQYREYLRRDIVGLGTESGIDVDATGGGDLRGLLKNCQPGRRPGKDLRVLASFVSDLAIGDEVAVPIPDDDNHLQLGVVTSDYEFSRRANTLVPHRRRVRWASRLDRSDVRPPALMQNPRRLFPAPVVVSARSATSG